MVYDIIKGHKITGQYGESRPGHTHKGIDLAYNMNDPILSSIDGRVDFIGFDPNGYGNYIDISGDNGLKVRYGHANKFNVKKGDVLKAGQQVGLVGSTGRSTGPHIHYEVFKNGANINPNSLDKLSSLSNIRVLPKGSINKMADLTQGIQDWAKVLANAQKERSPEEEQLKNDIVSMLNDKILQKIEMPKETTIQDVFNAKTGNGLETLADWLNSPQHSRLQGALSNSYTFNPLTKRMESSGSQLARKEEAKLQADQLKARELQKEQLGLAQNTYNNMNQTDMQNIKNMLDVVGMQERQNEFTQRLAQDQNQFSEQMNLQREKMQQENDLALLQLVNNQQKEQEKEQEKIDAKEQEYAEVEQQLKNFESMFDKVPNKLRGSTTGALRRMVGLSSNNEANFDAQRTLLFNTIARKLGGEKGVLSDGDIKRIEKALPTLSDSFQQRQAKMKAVYDLLDIKKGKSPRSNPLGLNL